MKLPKELRLLVIDQVILATKEDCWHLKRCCSLVEHETPLRTHWKRCCGLLRSCQLLRAETQQRISETITFCWAPSPYGPARFIVDLVRHFRLPVVDVCKIGPHKRTVMRCTDWWQMYMTRFIYVDNKHVSGESGEFARNGSCWDPIRLLADGEGRRGLFPRLKTLTIDFGGLDVLKDRMSLDKAVHVDWIIKGMAGRRIKTEKLLVEGLAKADAEKLLRGLSWGPE